VRAAQPNRLLGASSRPGPRRTPDREPLPDPPRGRARVTCPMPRCAWRDPRPGAPGATPAAWQHTPATPRAVAVLGQSADGEAPLACWVLHHARDGIDPGRRWPGPAPVDQRLDHGGRALEHGFHRPVREVADPPSRACLPGTARARGPETDALDASANHHALAHRAVGCVRSCHRGGGAAPETGADGASGVGARPPGAPACP